MQLSVEPITRHCPESEIYESVLPLDNARILELGCGRAELTRAIATGGTNREIIALEVDEIQHAKNLEITDLPNVTFALGGAESIPLDDASIDVVLMFKSLHHVPVERMAQGLSEVRRVLKPGGMAYVSEPIFAGEFNEILRLFHDEEKVRQAAFEAVINAVESGQFNLVEEIFFHAPMAFENFAAFEQQVIGVTHTDHQLSEEVYRQVKQRFEQNLGPEGAKFLMPIRVDLLQKGA
ncbi:MAG TPA: class I SAM-dependent methyltransferase [Chromatiales bacterium]|nr:class I SAM-dependent methyltransferase [Chromatiales bacterium]